MQPRPVAGRADYVAEAVALGVDRVMIDALVRDFYARVRADPLLGPVFAARIIDWEPHLELMGSFWCSVMLRTGTYHGRPMPKHASLPVDARHFDRWLALFEASAVRICPKAGHLFVERARRIAESLELGIAAARGQTLKIEERLASLSTVSPKGIGP